MRQNELRLKRETLEQEQTKYKILIPSELNEANSDLKNEIQEKVKLVCRNEQYNRKLKTEINNVNKEIEEVKRITDEKNDEYKARKEYITFRRGCQNYET